METATNKPAQNRIRYAFTKKPICYFHADEDFREDWDWGKEQSKESPAVRTKLRKSADRGIE